MYNVTHSFESTQSFMHLADRFRANCVTNKQSEFLLHLQALMWREEDAGRTGGRKMGEGEKEVGGE